MNNNIILCIDIGGTHITAAVLHGNDKSSSNLIRQAVDSHGTKDKILEEWDIAIRSVLDLFSERPQAMFISMPGPFDYANGICLMDGMHKYQSLLNMDIKAYFSTKYQIPSDSIIFMNDAHAFLLGEVYHHKWYDQKVVGITLGTGLGSALYDSKDTKDLNYGMAPFRSGTVEDYISTRGMLKYVHTQSDKRFSNIKEITERGDCDYESKIAFTFLVVALKEFILQYVVPQNIDHLVIGGSIAKAHGLFLEELQSSFEFPITIASMDEMNVFYGMISSHYLD